MPFVETSGGRVHYFVEGTGPPVLMVQGAGVIGEGWRPQIDALAPRFRIAAFDNQGIGRSTRPRRRLTIEAMALDALAVADALGFERFHLAGHSMGGLIAQQVALTERARVLTLSLLCSFAHGRQAAALSTAMLVAALRMRIGTRAMRRRAFTELIMPAAYLASIDGTALAERLRPLFGHDLASQPAFVMQQVRAMSRFDAAPRLGALAGMPTLVISASEDRIARPAFGRELASLIPGSRYDEIADAGHAVTIQRAEEVNALLFEHFEHGRAATPVEASARGRQP
jgi:pimeloyl-ACP methyl ester carboxylesterase